MTAETRLLRWPERQREDYLRLAGTLARLRAAAARTRGEIAVPVPTGPEEPSALDRARAMLAQRRTRDAAAGPDADLFSDPAWDMLLTLFIADREGRAPDRAAILDAAGLKPRATMRWLALLVDRGFVGPAERPTLTTAGRAFVERCVGGG